MLCLGSAWKYTLNFLPVSPSLEFILYGETVCLGLGCNLVVIFVPIMWKTLSSVPSGQAGREERRKVKKEGGVGLKISKATLSSFGAGLISGNPVAYVHRRQNIQNRDIQGPFSPWTHTPCCPGGPQLAGEWNLLWRPHSSSCNHHQHRHQLAVITKVFGVVNLLRFPDADNRHGKRGLRK